MKNGWQLLTTEIHLGGQTYAGGVSPVHQVVNGNGLLTGLTSTCGFALHLPAWVHVRVNYASQYYGRKSYAIGIEKCDSPPARRHRGRAPRSGVDGRPFPAGLLQGVPEELQVSSPW